MDKDEQKILRAVYVLYEKLHTDPKIPLQKINEGGGDISVKGYVLDVPEYLGHALRAMTATRPVAEHVITGYSVDQERRRSMQVVFLQSFLYPLDSFLKQVHCCLLSITPLPQ